MVPFSACPDHILTNLSQEIVGPNELHLTAVISGIEHDEVEYYWWLVHEINTPLYTFSVIFGPRKAVKFILVHSIPHTHAHAHAHTHTLTLTHISISSTAVVKVIFRLMKNYWR